MLLSTVRKLFAVFFAVEVLNACIIAGSLPRTTDAVSGYSSVDPSTINPGVLVVASTLLLVAVVLLMAIWIGSLVKTAQLAHWGWFVCILLPFVNIFALLAYLLFGPTDSLRPYQPKYIQPQVQFSQAQYPQAQYPQAQYPQPYGQPQTGQQYGQTPYPPQYGPQYGPPQYPPQTGQPPYPPQ